MQQEVPNDPAIGEWCAVVLRGTRPRTLHDVNFSKYWVIWITIDVYDRKQASFSSSCGNQLSTMAMAAFGGLPLVQCCCFLWGCILLLMVDEVLDQFNCLFDKILF